MSKHIINTFRKFILSAAFKALPLRSARLVEPEPVKSSLTPENDAWLFEAPRTVCAHMGDYATETGRLANALGNLRAVVSKASIEAPMVAALESAPALGVIWSDDLLFDGEPLGQESDEIAASADGHVDFLFDDAPHPVGTHMPFREDLRAA